MGSGAWWSWPVPPKLAALIRRHAAPGCHLAGWSIGGTCSAGGVPPIPSAGPRFQRVQQAARLTRVACAPAGHEGKRHPARGQEAIGERRAMDPRCRLSLRRAALSVRAARVPEAGLPRAADATAVPVHATGGATRRRAACVHSICGGRRCHGWRSWRAARGNGSRACPSRV